MDALMYSLTDIQKLELAAVTLAGDALQFFVEHIRNKVSSYDEF